MWCVSAFEEHLFILHNPLNCDWGSFLFHWKPDCPAVTSYWSDVTSHSSLLTIYYKLTLNRFIDKNILFQQDWLQQHQKLSSFKPEETQTTERSLLNVHHFPPFLLLWWDNLWGFTSKFTEQLMLRCSRVEFRLCYFVILLFRLVILGWQIKLTFITFSHRVII